MTALTPEQHEALSAEIKELQMEVDRLNNAMEGASVIANVAGSTIKQLKATIVHLIEASERYMNVMSDPQSSAAKGYIVPAKDAIVKAIATAKAIRP